MATEDDEAKKGLDPKNIKVARPDIMLEITDIDVEGMVYATFQDLGGIELIDTIRHDESRIINGLKEPIQDINDFIKKFNSGNILPTMEGSRKYFARFDYDLDYYVPKYLDPDAQNVRTETVENIDETKTYRKIIELINIPKNSVGEPELKVEIDIVSQQPRIRDIIY